MFATDVGGDQVARLPEISPFAIDRTKSAQEQVLRLAQQQRENASKRSQSGLAAAHTQDEARRPVHGGGAADPGLYTSSDPAATAAAPGTELMQKMLVQMQQQQEQFRQQQAELRKEREDFRLHQEQHAKQLREQQQVAEQCRQLEEKDAEECHRRQQEAQVKELQKTMSKLQRAVDEPTPAVTVTSADKTLQKMRREFESLRSKNKALEDQLALNSVARPIGHDLSCPDSAIDRELDSVKRGAVEKRRAAEERFKAATAGKAEQSRISSRAPSETSIRSQLKSARQQQDQYTKGLDIAIMMDTTGSMSWAIDSCKQQVSTILRQVQHDYPEANFRVAYISYKDHCDGDDRIAIHPFVDKADVSSLERFVAGIEASGGGGDGPEDIAGALQAAYDLFDNKEGGWRAQTRLIIHFADYPCHGTQYHSMGDDFPSGDPHGLVPEDILKNLAAKDVDYYFIEVAKKNTTKMTNIFKDAYPANVSVGFHVLPSGASPDKFLPAVLKRSGCPVPGQCRTSPSTPPELLIPLQPHLTAAMAMMMMTLILITELSGARAFTQLLWHCHMCKDYCFCFKHGRVYID